MGHYETAFWEPDDFGRTRRQRMGGEYRCYVPDLLNEMDFPLTSKAATTLLEAERALAKGSHTGARGPQGIARSLLRLEAASSSHIEGYEIGARRLLQAELQEAEPDNVRYDKKAKVVLGNIHAMEESVRVGEGDTEITLEDLCDIHRSLLRGTRLESYGGVIRKTQNWVGGSSFMPFAATYVPPKPEHLEGLLCDLVDFMNRDDLPLVLQMALVHSQFECIHPFADGNGRTGRALMHVLMARRKDMGGGTPPISLSIATERQEYYGLLNAMSHVETEDERLRVTDNWVRFISDCVIQSCEDMQAIRNSFDDLYSEWCQRLSGQSVDPLLTRAMIAIQSTPLFSVQSLARALDESLTTTNNLVKSLEQVGLVTQTNRGKRDRVYEVPEVLDEFNR